ncbi:MAG TPA: hypothetical protein VN932_13255 [Rhizomicrobium sp.]|nr:hypothetical protein [Rhizomicrobium sp.]
MFGLVGNIAAKLLSRNDAQAALTQKQAEWAHQTDMLKLQMQSRQARSDQDAATVPAEDAWTGLIASLKSEGAIPSTYRWVDAVRALVRPALTLGLVGVLAAAFFAMSPADIDRDTVIRSLVFAGVTAIVWWFGDRAPTRPR